MACWTPFSWLLCDVFLNVWHFFGCLLLDMLYKTIYSKINIFMLFSKHFYECFLCCFNSKYIKMFFMISYLIYAFFWSILVPNYVILAILLLSINYVFCIIAKKEDMYTFIIWHFLRLLLLVENMVNFHVRCAWKEWLCSRVSLEMPPFCVLCLYHNETSYSLLTLRHIRIIKNVLFCFFNAS